MNKDDFDETILDSEEAFNKRFKRIERPAFLDKLIKNKEAKNRITIYLDAESSFSIGNFYRQDVRVNVNFQHL